MMRKLYLTFLLLILLVGCDSRKAPTDESPKSLTAKVSPISRFMNQHGLKDKPVLIEFGMVGCELSDAGLKKMIEWQKKDRFPGLSYLRIEAQKDDKHVNQYYDPMKLSFEVVRHPDLSKGKLFQASAFPTFILVDKFGRVRYRGKLPEETKLAVWVDAIENEPTDSGSDVALFGVAKLNIPQLLVQTKLPDLQGKTKSLVDYQGKNGLLIGFVDTKCPYAGQAIREIPVISSLFGKHGIPTVLINVNDAKERVKNFFSSKKTGTPIVFDPGTSTQLQWHIQSVPTLILVNRKGKVYYNGPAKWDKVNSAVNDLLGVETRQPVKHIPRGTGFG